MREDNDKLAQELSVANSEIMKLRSEIEKYRNEIIQIQSDANLKDRMKDFYEG